jgi:hypothetical protein
MYVTIREKAKSEEDKWPEEECRVVKRDREKKKGRRGRELGLRADDEWKKTHCICTNDVADASAT